jgi:hypothetical protein
VYPVLVDHPVEPDKMVVEKPVDTSSKTLKVEHVASTGAADELPYRIRSNCYAYVKYVYPETPGTDTILANLSDSGEIAVFYYPKSGLYHYAVVESREPFIVSDTNYGSDTKKTRHETDLHLIGFYDLDR